MKRKRQYCLKKKQRVTKFRNEIKIVSTLFSKNKPLTATNADVKLLKKVTSMKF